MSAGLQPFTSFPRQVAWLPFFMPWWVAMLVLFALLGSRDDQRWFGPYRAVNGAPRSPVH